MPNNKHLLRFQIRYSLFSRRKEVWCYCAQRFWIIRRSLTFCIFNNRASNMHIWWSPLSFESSLAGTIQRCHSHSSAGVVELLHEFFTNFTWMAICWCTKPLCILQKNLKVELSSVGKMYVVSALLFNALTCLYGNETSELYCWIPQAYLSIWFDCKFCLTSEDLHKTQKHQRPFISIICKHFNFNTVEILPSLCFCWIS